MNGRWSELSDEALGRRLAAELPRYRAPESLRASILRTARPRRQPWLAPTLSALATAAVLVLALLATLPATPPADVVERLVGAVVAEHTRALLWGARAADIVPAALPRLTAESGIGLQKTFLGDDRLTFLGAEPVYLDWRRGMAIHYRDPDGHRVTYVVLPAPGMPLPERQRVRINDRFRPALVRREGFASWVWKQGDLACFLVSDLVSEGDLQSFKDYFVRVRVATEPYLVY